MKSLTLYTRSFFYLDFISLPYWDIMGEMQGLRKNIKYYFLGLMFLATFFIWFAVYAESRTGLTVTFLDVGQGDAIFIESANGTQVLLDGGKNKKILSELSKVMPFYDRSIDMIISSHPDADHSGGLPEVIKRFKIGVAMESGVESKSSVYREFKKNLAEKQIQTVLARKGTRINMGDGVYIDILFPIGDVAGWDANDASIIAKVTYGDTNFLLTGDSPQKIEKYLASVYQKGLKTSVLKVGHHGSKTSSAKIFLGYTNPDYAIISSGKDNRYGHPHKEVLDNLQELEISVLRTDELGTIKIKSNGEKIFVNSS